MKSEVRVFLSPSEYETLIDCAPNRETRLAMRLEAECSTRATYTTTIRRGDFFEPDDPDVDIVLLQVRGSKDPTEGENELSGSARLTWVPRDLYEEVEAFCEERGLQDDDELIPFGYEQLRKYTNAAADNAAVRTGNDEFRHVGTHDLRAYYATNMIKRLQVSKELVMEMGDWATPRAVDPYLAKSQPIEIQNGLARAGVLQCDVPSPPRRDELEGIYQQLQEIQKALSVDQLTSIDGLSLEVLQRLKDKHTPDDVDDESGLEQSSLSRLNQDDGAAVDPTTTAKLAYYACVVAVSWGLTLGGTLG